MSSQLDTAKLAKMIKSKRGSKGLRTIAEEIGNVSASTLSRIEQGKLPDVDTFLKICYWLNVSPEMFHKKSKVIVSDRDKIEAHLRADKNLDEETANAVIHMIDLAYNKKISPGEA